MTSTAAIAIAALIITLIVVAIVVVVVVLILIMALVVAAILMIWVVRVGIVVATAERTGQPKKDISRARERGHTIHHSSPRHLGSSHGHRIRWSRSTAGYARLDSTSRYYPDDGRSHHRNGRCVPGSRTFRKLTATWNLSAPRANFTRRLQITLTDFRRSWRQVG